MSGATDDINDRPAATNPTGMRSHTTTVAGRPVIYGAVGQGPTVVFMHGWGLTPRSYRPPLTRLAETGVRVIAPALPGFGGTADLPPDQFHLPGYAAWVDQFLQVAGITGPVTAVGHSFGGGIGARLAHDTPARVDRLVLVNSIGGSAWTGARGVLRALTDRPLTDWSPDHTGDTLALRQLTRVLPALLEDAVPNLVRNPAALWRVAGLARAADLTAELAALRRRPLPVTLVWGRHDTLLPRSGLSALRAALDHPEVIEVPGNHNWLLHDPERFADVVSGIVRGPCDEWSGHADRRRRVPDRGQAVMGSALG